MESPVGPLNLAASEGGLVLLEFARPTFPPTKGKFANVRWQEGAGKLRLHIGQVQEYFARRRRDFNLPLDLRGTDFQMLCWRALLEIRYGETRTYGQIARAIGHPGAFRAVGMANHDNPIAIVVPCHRVVASNGTLCGYGGGLSIKRMLLKLEGVSLDKAGRLQNQDTLFASAS